MCCEDMRNSLKAPLLVSRGSGHEEFLSRVLGVIVLLGGSTIGWFSVWFPLQKAANHARFVPVSLTLTIFSPLLIGMGIIYSVAPRWAIRVLGKPREQRGTIFYSICIALLAAGLLLYWGVRRKVETYGYEW